MEITLTVKSEKTTNMTLDVSEEEYEKIIQGENPCTVIDGLSYMSQEELEKCPDIFTASMEPDNRKELSMFA